MEYSLSSLNISGTDQSSESGEFEENLGDGWGGR